MRILLVEDEFLIATMLQDMLTGLVACQLSWASRVPAALKLVAEKQFDGAILDVNVAGERVYPVADQLRQRGVPIVFSTGYIAEHVLSEYTSFPVLVKPYSIDTLARAVEFLRSKNSNRPDLATA